MDEMEMPNTNALKELMDEGIDLFDIVALRMNFNGYRDFEPCTITYQKGIDSLSKLKEKLSGINYLNDWGYKAMFGIILMNDGSYWERGEYDGATYWEHHVVPTIEQVLNYNREN